MESRPLFKAYMLKHKKKYIIGGALLSMSCLLQLVIPQLLGRFTDFVLQVNYEISSIIWIAVWIVGIGIVSAIFRAYSRIYIFRLARKLEREVRRKLFIKWESLSSEYFNRNRIGDLMSHAVNDINILRELGTTGVFMMIEASVMILIAIIAMGGTVHIGLTLLVLLPLPALTYLAYRFRAQMQLRTTRVQEAIGDLASRVQEFVAGIRVVKAYAQEDAEANKFDEANQNNVESNRHLIHSNSSFNALSHAIVGVSYLLSVVFGGLLVMNGGITLGEFVAFNTYLIMLVAPVENLGKVINAVQRGVAVDKRLRHILNTQADVADEDDVVTVSEIKGDIQFRNLNFRYPDQKQFVLEDINLHIPEGSSLAIVGKVGSGKTTLVNLLMRLYNPPIGTLFIDGREIRKYPLKQLRQSIGFVPQAHMLFSTTIGQNIAFDPTGYTIDEICEAAKSAQVHDNIVEFPRQFDTSLGERGVSLSGGQRQRVSIARALIKSPSILVFDDSLSAVDAITEEKILDNMKRQMQGRTTIITSHRLSAIQHADQIIVLDHGRIVEQGNHSDLLRLGGHYASIYEKQTMNQVMGG